MKTLNEYIKESLLDIEGTLDSGNEAIKKSIEKWINDNYRVKYLKISDNPNNDNIYEVDARDVFVKNKNIKSLTNDLFVWKTVRNYFNCCYCKYLTSLEGSPEKVDGDFGCTHCDSLTSLKGAPREVGGEFYCSSCKSLKSLEGAPEKVYGYFSCSNCDSLTSLEGAPEKVGGNFYCDNCPSLKSTDLPATTKVKGEIFE